MKKSGAVDDLKEAPEKPPVTSAPSRTSDNVDAVPEEDSDGDLRVRRRNSSKRDDKRRRTDERRRRDRDRRSFEHDEDSTAALFNSAAATVDDMKMPDAHQTFDYLVRTELSRMHV